MTKILGAHQAWLAQAENDLLKAASVLDLYYVTARYPNVLPGDAPYASFHPDQATEAVKMAAVFVKKAKSLLRARTK